MQSPFNQIPSLTIKTISAGKHELKYLEGDIHLSAWEGFQSRRGPYNAIDRSRASDGNIRLTAGDYVAAEEALAVSPEMVHAYHIAIEQQEKLKENILNALLPQYKEWRQEYGYEDDDVYMPAITQPSQFKNLLGLSAIHLMDVSKEGVAYVGYEFGCNWDDEHGLGVMTHKDRIIEIGAADTSFESWIAEKDLDPIKAAEELRKAVNSLPPRPKKPWWKFW